MFDATNDSDRTRYCSFHHLTINHLMFDISMMPIAYSDTIELSLKFDYTLSLLEEILDNLFFMRLELEDGCMPVFPEFDAMKTIGKCL